MKIAILLYEGFTALDAIGPYEVLSRLPEATVHFVAEHSGPQPTDTHSLSLIAETPLSALPNPDIFVIPGGMVGTFAAAENPTMLAKARFGQQEQVRLDLLALIQERLAEAGITLVD